MFQMTFIVDDQEDLYHACIKYYPRNRIHFALGNNKATYKV